jgi:hypothetical protein
LAGAVSDFTETTDLSGEGTHITDVATSQTKELDYIYTEFGLGTVNVTNQEPLANDCEVEVNGAHTCASTLYFFHPDHLGSSTFLSNETGQAYQFLLYLP